MQLIFAEAATGHDNSLWGFSSHDIYGVMLIVGFIVGCLAYLFFHWRDFPDIDGVRTGMSGACGFAVAAGVHLLICSIFPDQLVEHVYANGAHVSVDEGIICHMDKVHRLHIAIGGIVTIFVGFKDISMLCKGRHE